MPKRKPQRRQNRNGGGDRRRLVRQGTDLMMGAGTLMVGAGVLGLAGAAIHH